jgi:hypothetical protein
MVDAYSTAKKMNDKEIPFSPTKTAHLILFFIVAGLILLFVLFFLFVILMGIVVAPVMHPPTGSRF